MKKFLTLFVLVCPLLALAQIFRQCFQLFHSM
jgi:hypothetical protein